MSDILLHAAIKEKDRLTAASSGGAGASVDSYTNPQPCDTPGISQYAQGGTAINPTMVDCWQAVLTPLACPRGNGFKVCDGSSYYRCGADCNWCVPAGVSKVLFQVWAPGGGTSSNCCCGGAPFGPSGSFYMTEINVSQGECYCLRAGCAYCCYAYQTTPGAQGEDSCIRSCSNNKICLRVLAAQSCYCTWVCQATLALGWQCSCGNAMPTKDNCSPHQCDGWNFCWDSGSDCVDVPHFYGCRTWCEDTTSAAKNFGYGIPNIWPRMYIQQGTLENSSYSISPPVFGFENMTCCSRWQNSTCSGCCRCAQQGIQQGPGFGGFASQVHGGCQACGGDSGGMGMICVSYNCS